MCVRDYFQQKNKNKKKRCGFISQFGLRPPIDQPFFLSLFEMVKNIPPIWAATPYTPKEKFGVLLFSQVQRRRFLSTNHTRNNNNKKQQGSVWMMNGIVLYAKRHNLTYDHDKENKDVLRFLSLCLSHRVSPFYRRERKTTAR